MGAYLFFIVCTSLWLAFGWALATRPAVLDQAWGRVRGLPLLAKPVVWSDGGHGNLPIGGHR